MPLLAHAQDEVVAPGWHNLAMPCEEPDGLAPPLLLLLREAGASFAYLFGSRAEGCARPGSDVDVAAWFGDPAFDELALAGRLPSGTDLLVLDRAPLELAGRVAMRGRLLFDDAPPARVAWEATTRKLWLDERPRLEVSRRLFREAAAARG